MADTGRARASVCLLALVALGSVGCASRGDAGDAVVAAEMPASDEAAEGEADDLAAAEAALLTLDDLPSGWEADPADEPDGDVAIDDDVERCLGVDNDDPLADAPYASSPTFTGPANEEVAASVTIAPSADVAVRAIEPLHSPEAPGCFAQAFGAQLQGVEGPEGPEGVEIGEPTFEPIALGTLGEESVAIAGRLPARAQGMEIALHGAAVFARVGRGLIVATFVSSETPISRPISTDQIRQLSQIVVDRLSAAGLDQAADD
jgi:hypothetical protein